MKITRHTQAIFQNNSKTNNIKETVFPYKIILKIISQPRITNVSSQWTIIIY